MALRGVQDAQRELANLQAKVKQAQRAGEKKVADKIAAEARVAAPGSIPSKINVTQTENSTVIDGGDELAAYVEFGTGEYAAALLSTVPPEQVEEARKFFKNGKGRTPAQPFFFPAIYRNQEAIVPAVEEELKKINK